MSDDRPTNPVHTTAQRLVAAGLSIIPIRPDGSKAPPVEWGCYQERHPDDAELGKWFRRHDYGLGLVAGAISGNVEILDFDAVNLFAPWADLVEEDSPGLLQRLPVIQTPTGGRHVYYRCPTIAGNQKLAQHLSPDGRPETAIETRGEGGYVIIPPLPPACHPAHIAYQLLDGDLSDIPVITPDERAILLNAARMFNTYVPPAQIRNGAASHPSSDVMGERPGDLFNARASWEDILRLHGWAMVGHRDEVSLWRRPGKGGRGISATTNYAGSDLLHVFSTNALPFEPETSYSKFSAYALLNYGGDFTAAAKALAGQGYGDRHIPLHGDSRVNDHHTLPLRPYRGYRGLRYGRGRLMAKESRARPPKAPPELTEHLVKGGLHSLTFKDGVTVEVRNPHYDRQGRLWGAIVAKLDSAPVNEAQINLLDLHQRVDFHQVAMVRDGRVDWQDYLLSVIAPIREALDRAVSSGNTDDTPRDPLRTPTLVTLSDVMPEPVTWLWEPYIPLCKLTLLEGDPGQGKTWLALAIAAATTHGLTPWSGEPCLPADVLYLSAEDGLADTLRPRLDAAGADVTRVHCLTGWPAREVSDDVPLSGGVTLADVELLGQAMVEKKPVLVVVDPLQGYLGAKVDIHRANETRPLLAALAALAEQHGCAILLIRHLSKAPQDRAIYRGLGSIDFAAAARSILLAGQDPEAQNRRVLAHVKSSLTPLGPSLGYELREGRFLWTGRSDVTADDLLRPYPVQDERSAVEEAQDFLREFLADGGKPAKDVVREAKKAGIQEITLRRAKKGMVRAEKSHPEGQPRGAGIWTWSLSLSPGDVQDDHGEHLPLQTPDDHLEHPEKESQNQLVASGLLDDQMISLNNGHNRLRAQCVRACLIRLSWANNIG